MMEVKGVCRTFNFSEKLNVRLIWRFIYLQCLVVLNCLTQKCPIRFLEGHCPAEFSSKTHLNQLIKVLQSKLETGLTQVYFEIMF